MSNITYNSQQPSNLNSNGNNNTTQYFNNFYVPGSTVSSNTNDAIVSYFQQQTGSIDSATVLAQAVINTAAAQRQDPMIVLTEFQTASNGQLSPLLALFLNTSRVPTSLLGVKNKPVVTPYVARTVLV
jgi:hypothetical protein